MKKGNKCLNGSIWLLLLVWFLFSGCQQKDIQDDTYIEGQDSQFMFQSQGLPTTIAASEDGYYVSMGCFLYYMDKQTKTPVILCNKPNCRHENETDPEKVYNCNAYVHSQLPGAYLAWYRENLYTVSNYNPATGNDKPELIKISPDGSKRDTVYTFDGEPSFMTLHRGTLYFNAQRYGTDGSSDYQLVALPLSNPKKAEVIYQGDLEDGYVSDIQCFGTHLYFEEFGMGDDSIQLKIMHYNLLTKETKRIFTDDDHTLPSNPIITNKRLYYALTDKSTIDMYNTSPITETFYTASLDGSSNSTAFTLQESGEKFTDGKYIYVIFDDYPKNRRLLRILNEEGKRIDEIDVSFLPVGQTLCGGDSSSFLIKYKDSDSFYLKYINKEDFGKGNLLPNLLLQRDSDKMMPAIVYQNSQQ